MKCGLRRRYRIQFTSSDIARTRTFSELCPNETRLYGTESFYGDWDGELLLLAKDFAPASLVRERLSRGDPRPYHHTDWQLEPMRTTGATTNKKLFGYAEKIEAGKLYGSVLAGLLRNDGKTRGSLPHFQELGLYIGEVLKFTLENMPNLRVIAFLGGDAWACSELVRRQVKAKDIKSLKMGHPSASITTVQFEKEWHMVRQNLRSR